MPTKLTPKERLKLIERALKGDNISYLCKSAGISRTLLYRWIKRYKADQRKNKLLVLKPRQKEATPSRAVPSERIKLIFDFVRTHPEWSVGKIVENLPKDDKGKSLVGHHGVQNVLKHFNLNTVEKRQNFQKQPQNLQYPPDVYTKGVPESSTIGYEHTKQEILKPQFSEIRPQDRLAMIERVKLGEPVSRVCKIYGVSRTIFYRWLKRYEEAPEGKKLEALWEKKPVVDKYFNQAPEEYKQVVLSAVRQYPELSTHKLVWVLPQVGGRPILGNHGVQNVLHRYNLNTYEQRLAYAQAYRKPTFLTQFFGVFQTIFSLVGTQTSGVRAVIVRSTLIIALAVFLGTVFYGASGFINLVLKAPSITFSIGILFSFLALIFGMLFFLYSLKYYFAISVVLSFSRRTTEEEKREENGQSLLEKLFGVSISVITKHPSKEEGLYEGGGGLQPDLSRIRLERHPFVSIHIATYNEKKVVERLLTAATSLNYENYEVIIIDDSNDETIQILNKWRDHPRVKVVHRQSREGFKGGALREALKIMDKRAELIIVFDADFIPYPDTITQFLKYFQATSGTLDFRNQKSERNPIGAIQGYQWHVLNKSENWITRGIRSEYAGSYVVERSATEIYGGFKQIAGSVYMIRVDVLRDIGWGTSITEDFELSLKLYEKGYKVVYTPYVQAPSECVSTIRRLIRQRMRWAEGHSFNVKKMFLRLLFSKNLSFSEKAEFVYLSPYYLQAFFFMLGTFFWFTAEVVFRVVLPFWTEVWGWSLVFTNLLALPLLNMVGLFLEESEEKDYLGLGSFTALSYIIAPFQAYAAVKGFIAEKEGPWFRTPKTGRITDIFTPGRFYRFIFGVFGRPAIAPASQPVASNLTMQQFNHNQYLAYQTANNRFNSFSILPRRLKWLGRTVLAILLMITVSIYSLAYEVSEVYATNPTGTFRLHDAASAVLTTPASWQLQDAEDTTTSTATSIKYGKSAVLTARFRAGVSNNATSEDPAVVGPDYGWIFDTPFGSDGTIASGTWNFTICRTGTDTAGDFGYLRVRVYNVDASAGSITASTLLYDSGTNFSATDITLGTISNVSLTSATIGPFTTTRQYLFVDYFLIMTTNDGSAATDKVTFNAGLTTCATSPRVVTPAVTIPENLILLIFFVPFIPVLIKWLKKRRYSQYSVPA